MAHRRMKRRRHPLRQESHRMWTLASSPWTIQIACIVIASLSLAALVACHGAQANEKTEAPPPARVTPDVDVSLFAVDHPDRVHRDRVVVACGAGCLSWRTGE